MPDSLVSQFRREFSAPIETSRQVATITARDNISTSRRWQGMLVFVVSEQKTYELRTAVDNTGWEEIGGAGGDPVETAAMNPLTRVLTLTKESAATVTVNLSASTVLNIDGYQVKKGAGKTDPDTIEITDKIVGWNGDEYLAGEVTALPYTTAGNVKKAISGTML